MARPKTRNTPRKRERFCFWLDVETDEQLILAEEIDGLKSSRQFAPTIRNALRLFIDLTNGRIDSLLEFFPSIEDYFREKYSTPKPSPATTEFEAIMKRLDQIASQPVMALPASTTRTHIDIPKMELPQLDLFSGDDGVSAEETREVFAAGMGNLFSEADDDLWK